MKENITVYFCPVVELHDLGRKACFKIIVALTDEWKARDMTAAILVSMPVIYI